MKGVETRGHVARREQMRNAYKILVRKRKVKRPDGKPRGRWEDNIQMDLEGECGNVDWDQLAPDRVQWRTLVNTVINYWHP